MDPWHPRIPRFQIPPYSPRARRSREFTPPGHNARRPAWLRGARRRLTARGDACPVLFATPTRSCGGEWRYDAGDRTSAFASRNLILPFGPPIRRMAKGPPARLHARGGAHDQFTADKADLIKRFDDAGPLQPGDGFVISLVDDRLLDRRKIGISAASGKPIGAMSDIRQSEPLFGFLHGPPPSFTPLPSRGDF